jgi:PAS domain S-box-containing protein
MIVAKATPNEHRRIAALRSYDVLDSPAEQELDDLVCLAAQICGAPIALISLLDTDRQWFKAKTGWELAETPRDISFCSHAIYQRELFIVPDAAEDERFADNPLVTGEPGIRFYAGAPLVSPQDEALGALCVIDRVPRRLTPAQEQSLRVLARQVMTHLELHRRMRELREMRESRNVSEPRHAEIASPSLASIVEFSDDAIIGKDLNSIITSWNKGAEKIFGYAAGEMVGTSIMRLIPEDRREEEDYILDKIKRGENLKHFETRRKTKDGRLIDVSVTASPIKDAAGKVIGVSKVARDWTARKRADQRLNLLDACVSKLNDIVLVTEAEPIDEPGPKIVFVNEALERLTGYTAAEALGRSPRFLQGEKTDRLALGEIRQALRRQQPIRRQIINYGKDGSEYWLDIDIAPIFDAAGKCTHFAAIQRNITEWKLAEETRRATEGRYRTLFENAPDGILIADPENQFIDANASICRMLGYAHRELIGLHGSDIIARHQCSRIAEAFREVKAAVDHHQEWQFRRKDDTLFSGDAIATLMPDGNVMVMIRDITERNQAQEQIAEQAALLDKARDAILVRDIEGKVLYWNNGAERMYGWTRQEALGRNVSGLFYLDPKKFEAVNGQTIREGEWNGELQHETMDRGGITVEARWTLIRDNQGQPKSVLAINTDITERKKIEAQFLRAQRMESIGTLAGGVAHDLNNILAPIMMSIEILKTTTDRAQVESILEMLEVSAKRGADIVRQVLSFARGVEGERIEVQPKHLLSDLESIIKDTFPKDIRLRFSIPEGTWTILGDPTQVHQILLNLCVNARDAMPNGGSLSVGVENRLLDEQYAAMNFQAKPGRYVMISVTDSGTGIPPKILEKIFEPFFTTKDINKGTGLGLSTVTAIVKSHEGFVTVYSEPGEGTAFKVYLPAMETGAQARDQESEIVSLPRGNGETILVIDDEISIRTITSRTLDTFGYRALAATDGAEAVAVYAENKKEIAVVITDMMMPIMDGPATIHALMRINPAVKIVAASGLNSPGGVAKASIAGVKHFLTKPYTAGTLLKTIRAILDEV